jgi:Spy/CpxP family protein refolding chaperone
VTTLGRHVWEDKTHMTFTKLFGTAALAVAALSLAAAAGPASARGNDPHHRHEHKVCKWERHHGHKQKVCRWVHN